MDYTAAWKIRLQEDEERRLTLLRDARSAAEKAARILVEQFGAEKVYLIGSLVNDEAFTDCSDIDIAISGLKTENYFKALDSIWGLLPAGIKGIDLVPIEDADEYMKSVILQEGIILYDKKQPACP